MFYTHVNKLKKKKKFNIIKYHQIHMLLLASFTVLHMQHTKHSYYKHITPICCCFSLVFVSSSSFYLIKFGFWIILFYSRMKKQKQKDNQKIGTNERKKNHHPAKRKRHHHHYFRLLLSSSVSNMKIAATTAIHDFFIKKIHIFFYVRFH